MRTILVAALLATLAGPALAQMSSPTTSGASNGASSVLGAAPTGSFAPAARAAGAGASPSAPVPYTGTKTASPGHTAGTPPPPTGAATPRRATATP